MRRKCEHLDVATWWSGLPVYAYVERCEDCGHWLSLGPSNDEPASVQVEIWAALVQSNYWAMGLILACPDETSGPGWDLARCIWEHGHEQGGES